MGDQEVATVSGAGTAIKFDTLKPICCDVMKTPSVETLSKLRGTLEHLPPKSITPEILNYVSFPLVVHLKAINRLRAEVKLSLLETLSKILAISGVDNFQCFFEIFQAYSIVLGTKGGVSTTEFNTSLSEEIVQYIEEGMVSLLKNSLIFHCQILYDAKRVQAVGHCIFMQLQLITSELPLNIRLRAIEVVESLFVICAGNEDMCHHIFNFLPGVVIALRKSSSSKVGRVRQSLIVKSVGLITKCVTISISFETPDKLEIVDQNLSILFSSLSDELVANDDPVLRNAILNLSMNTILEAGNKIPKCEEVLWKNILIQCWDQSDDLSTKSRLFLKENQHRTQLCDFDNMMANLKNSQEQFMNNDLDRSVTSLKNVASSLFVKKLLFVELNTFLPPFANLLTTAILKHQLDLDKEIDSTFFKRNPFLQVCDSVCKSLREAVNFDDFFEEIVPFLTFNSALPFSERVDNGFVGVLFLFNKILSTFVIVEGADLDKGLSYDVTQICDLTTISTLFLEVLDLQLTDRIQVNPKTLTSIEYESVLLIEGLGLLASLDSQCVLPMVLYYLLEHAGDQESILISNTAKNSLVNISKCYSLEFQSTSQTASECSLEEFLSQNLDLIMSELSVRISSISSHPKCPNALIFLAEYFDFSQKEFVNLIEQGFTQSCDYFYTTSQKAFTKLFYAFIYSLWNQRKDKLYSQTKEITTKSQTRESLCTKLLNYQKALGIEVEPAIGAQKLIDECDRVMVEEVQTVEQQNSRKTLDDEGNELGVEHKLLPELKLVLKICQRVLNFIPSHEDRTIQLTSMDCLIMGVQLLKNVDDALLPLAHTIWPNLAHRFTENDLVIVQKSFELLLALCRISGSFLKKRVVQQVFPKLSQLLVSLAGESERVEQRHVLYYTYTQAYKLQMIILEGLADLSLSIELSEEELDQIVSGCLLYLKPQQHKNLREAALKVIETFANSEHSGIIWMKLIAHGLRKPPAELPHPLYTVCPHFKIL